MLITQMSEFTKVKPYWLNSDFRVMKRTSKLTVLYANFLDKQKFKNTYAQLKSEFVQYKS